jgi:WD repeat-containing protein 35
LKAGDVAEALNTCIKLNQWGKAIELAELHRFKDVQSLLSQYAEHIISQKRIKEAVELYRRANLCLESAALLFQMAQDAQKSIQSPLHLKKLYVLGALEVERYHALQKSNQNDTTAALDGLLKEDRQFKSIRIDEHPWRGAEAYHYYILAQRQFNNCQFEQSVITATLLIEYENILGPLLIYSLLALVSLHAGYYGTCSKAFIRLESIEGPESEYYKELAIEIFTRYSPKDPEDESAVCTNCLSSMKERY